MRTIRFRGASRTRIAAVGALAATAVGGLLAVQAPAGAAGTPKGPISDVTVRVEGLTKTLLVPTTVTLRSGAVSKGPAADSCSALSALGALADATHGSWGGTWSASYKQYFVTTILGQTYKSSAPYYWAFWLDNRPAPVGACDVDPAKGSSILFFPEYDGKSKSIHAPNVLGISAPASAQVGKPFTLLVTSYANASGKPSPAVGARVYAGAVTATAKAGGKATLKLTKAGEVAILATAPGELRDEATVCVYKSGTSCAG